MAIKNALYIECVFCIKVSNQSAIYDKPLAPPAMFARPAFYTNL